MTSKFFALNEMKKKSEKEITIDEGGENYWKLVPSIEKKENTSQDK